MNFSFASAPNTPYIPQADGRSALSGVNNSGSSGGGIVGGTQGFSASVAAAAIHAAATTHAGGSGSVGGFVGATRATDPLNDIGSPVNLQYLQYAMSSPFFISDTAPTNLAVMGSPAVSAIGLGPKRSQAAPTLIVTASASPTTGMSASGTAGVGVPKLVLSPVMDDTLPGFFHPAEVFTTPKITHLSDVSQKTPDLGMFDDSEAIISALSPRTQTAQAGLSLLAASATYARSPAGSSSNMFGQQPHHGGHHGGYSHRQPQQPQLDDMQGMAAVGSPFLNANGVDATLMSQPQNSLAHQLSPQLMDHHHLQQQHHHQQHQYHQQSQQQYNYRQGSGHGSQQFNMSALGGGSIHNNANGGGQVLGNTGRLMHKRSLLRQSSGLTNASFHNDLVPQPTESFFAPLDEVCSDSDAIAAAAAGGMGYGGSSSSSSRAIAQPLHRQPTAPRLGSQFSPIMSSGLTVSSAHGQVNHGPRSPQQQQPQRFQSPPTGFAPRNSWMQSQYQLAQSAAQAQQKQLLPPPHRPHGYLGAPAHRQQVLSAPVTNGSSSIPGIVFSQMPSLSSSSVSVAAARPSTAGNGSSVPPGGGYLHRGSSLPNDNTIDVEDEEDEEDEDEDEERMGRHQFSPGGSEASDLSLSDSHGGSGEPNNKRRRTSGAPTHKRDQQRRFDCDICNRSFARQYNLKTHRMTHFPEVQASRPFKCPHCVKAFTRKHDLQRHAVLHERTDKYTCPRCHMGFQRKDAMKKHLESPQPCQDI
ncbi:hypothetical protein GGH94_005922 [Coemansia aciculifera]|uniref:C2H2-type domain-containing protein n=1 Tax=Coemansia aciculifera TaxID=417176 RepID=A0A9W8IF59_9FUNG|nr:hypothetical protein GGH94_005922 [Coemansia aciculifera]KAJ2869874.1 hypothetical protein GGH93_006004 [Coemansia aciculifera]